MSEWVHLEPYECRRALAVGRERQEEQEKQDRSRELYGADQVAQQSLVVNQQSAGAEQAVAKRFNLYWHGGVNVYHSIPDVGLAEEVRWATRPEYGLLTRPNDLPTRTYFLVLGSIPDFQIVGWLPGRLVFVDCYYCNPRNKGWCYIVPAAKLLPPSLFKSYQVM